MRKKPSDQQVIDYIIKRCGGRHKAGAALGIHPASQSLTNWRARGISPTGRHLLWNWCRANGLALDDDWLVSSLLAHGRRPMHTNTTTNGGTNGRAGKGKPRKEKARAKGQRHNTRRRSQQRGVAGNHRQVAA